jgi:hypothetical protein
MKCSSETGSSLVICTAGSGELKNRTFRYCGIRGRPIAGVEYNVCGALAVMKEGTCESESCYFEGNVDGSVWIGGQGIFRNCDFVDNEGYCRDLYVNNARLSLFSCYFECNQCF